MRMTLAGVASALCLSFGCSSAPPASSQAALHANNVAVTHDWAVAVARQFAPDPHQLPPAVVPPNPILRRDGDTNPRGPACMLCPTAMGARASADGWELAGRPDPVEIATALGAPALAAPIADRITDAEIALAEASATDRDAAETIVRALAADLDGLAQQL